MSDHPSNGWEQPKQAGWEFREQKADHHDEAEHSRP